MIVPHRLKESNKARRRVRRVGWFVVEESWGDIEGWGGRLGSWDLTGETSL